MGESRRERNCLGIVAFMREPVPPARIRKPTLERSGKYGAAAAASSVAESADDGRMRGWPLELAVGASGALRRTRCPAGVLGWNADAVARAASDAKIIAAFVTIVVVDDFDDFIRLCALVG